MSIYCQGFGPWLLTQRPVHTNKALNPVNHPRVYCEHRFDIACNSKGQHVAHLGGLLISHRDFVFWSWPQRSTWTLRLWLSWSSRGQCSNYRAFDFPLSFAEVNTPTIILVLPIIPSTVIQPGPDNLIYTTQKPTRQSPTSEPELHVYPNPEMSDY